MLRAVYTLLAHLLLPLIPLRLWWRGRREPGYLQHVGERFGSYAAVPRGPVIWVHAVSVGEVRAAQPLIDAIAARYPEQTLLVTCMTATGRATAESLYGSRAQVCFLPYDYPWAVARFLDHFRPTLGVLMETEIWPNLLRGAARRRIPVVLANARMSARSARGYARVGALTRTVLADFAAIGAQSEADALRLAALGARLVQVTGNLKFDVALPADLAERGRALRDLYGDRPVLLAASTREGEEALLVDALGDPPPGLLTVIVPRHPQRFDDVAALFDKRGIACVRRSERRAVPPDCAFVLGDSMGEMLAYYAACDVAFVGGSLLPYGAQNLIEACAAGAPVLIGPSTFNFAQAAELAIAAGAARPVADAAALVREARALLADRAARQKMAEAGRDFTATHRGATARTMTIVTEVLAAATVPAGGNGRG